MLLNFEGEDLKIGFTGEVGGFRLLITPGRLYPGSVGCFKALIVACTPFMPYLRTTSS